MKEKTENIPGDPRTKTFDNIVCTLKEYTDTQNDKKRGQLKIFIIFFTRILTTMLEITRNDK